MMMMMFPFFSTIDVVLGGECGTIPKQWLTSWNKTTKRPYESLAKIGMVSILRNKRRCFTSIQSSLPLTARISPISCLVDQIRKWWNSSAATTTTTRQQSVLPRIGLQVYPPLLGFPAFRVKSQWIIISYPYVIAMTKAGTVQRLLQSTYPHLSRVWCSGWD